MRYKYRTKGTCSMQIEFDINGDIISNVVLPVAKCARRQSEFILFGDF